MARTDKTALIELRDGFASVLEEIEGLKVYDHSPAAGVDALPGVELGLPLFRRTVIDEAESELGSDDLFLEWPFALHVAMDDVVRAQRQALELVGEIIGVVDAYPTLSLDGLQIAADAKVAGGEGTFVVRNEDGSRLDRPKIVYELELHAHKLVSY